jgi:hypothetical protein
MDKDRAYFVIIGGRRYKLHFPKELEERAHGWCYAPDAPAKEIQIKKGLRGERLLDSLIHEMLHAAAWDMSEEWVEKTASEIARVLHRLGYRDGHQ